MDKLTPKLTPLRATGIYNELVASLRITSDHLKFMRMFSDPTEVDIFVKTTELANELDNIRDKIAQKAFHFARIPEEEILEYEKISLENLRGAVKFGNDLTEKVKSCKSYIQIKHEDIQHMRKETDFFLGIFDAIINNTFNRDAKLLGIPIKNQLMATIPRVCIDKLPYKADEVIMTWAYFWTHQNSEHATLLRSFTRHEDKQLIQDLINFENDWKNVSDIIIRDHFTIISQVSPISENWEDFLWHLLGDIKFCRIIEGFPKRLVEHMIIENQLLRESVVRYTHNSLGVVFTEKSEFGAIYDQFPSLDMIMT